MTPIEMHPAPSEHSVELSNQIIEQASSRRRRTLGAVIVAICLSAASAIIVLAALRAQHDRMAELLRESLQREELRDGWQTLSAVAAQGAQNAPTPNATAPASSAPAPAATTIVIVNVPTSAPSGATSPRAVPDSSQPPPPQSSVNAQPIYVPIPVVPEVVSGVPLPGQSQNPGSQANPALPNGSSVTQPNPGLPNGNLNSSSSTPSLPTATVPLPPP